MAEVFVTGWATGWNRDLWHWFLPDAKKSACGKLARFDGARDRPLGRVPAGEGLCATCLKKAKESNNNFRRSIATEQ